MNATSAASSRVRRTGLGRAAVEVAVAILASAIVALMVAGGGVAAGWSMDGPTPAMPAPTATPVGMPRHEPT